MVGVFRQEMMPTDRIHTVVTNGGVSTNVIPDYTKSEWGIRSASQQRLAVLLSRTETMLKAAAAGSNTTLTLTP
jgi:metal-dependent amidase/aminoacylase/carboxypeptidase family protein